MRHPAELTAAFRARGLKLTPQRQLLFRLLHDNSTHPSAEALFAAASAQMPGISLRTVYQTLNDLVAMGELQQLHLDPGSARFDPNVGDHHHVVCDVCGDVRDVYCRRCRQRVTSTASTASRSTPPRSCSADVCAMRVGRGRSNPPTTPTEQRQESPR